MKAAIENLSELPQVECRRVVRWVLGRLGVDDGHVTVRIRETDNWHHYGHFYAQKNGSQPQILILANVPEQYVGKTYHRGIRNGPPPIVLEDWQEALVCILAHEGTHICQWYRGPYTDSYIRTTKSGSKHVAGRIFNEADAEWAEFRLLHEWRERRKP